MFLLLVFLKADKPLSCKAGVGRAPCAPSKIQWSEVKWGSRLSEKEEFFPVCHFWLMPFFVPRSYDYLKVSQAVSLLWIDKLLLLAASIEPNGLGYMITPVDKNEISCHRVVSDWQLFALQFFMWELCSTVRSEMFLLCGAYSIFQ